MRELSFFLNGCDFSESSLPEDILENYVACNDFFSKNDYDNAMEKAYQINKKYIQ